MAEMQRADSVTIQRQLTAAVLDALWPKLCWQRGEDFVLDVGCGRGDGTAYELLPRLPEDVRVVAADASYSTLTAADTKFAGPRLCFLQLHVDTPHIHNTGVWRLGPYSKVFSFFSLQWVRNQKRAIQNISELLCSGGEAALAFISRTALFAIYENLAKSTKWSSYLADYLKFLPPYQLSEDPKEEFGKFLEQAGLTVKACTENEILYVTQVETEVRETMIALNPFLGRIPKDNREEYMRDCEEEAFKSGGLSAQRLPSGKVSYVLSYKALVAHALKK